MNKTVLTSFTISCLLSTVFLIGYKVSVKAMSDCSIYVPDDYAEIQWAIGNASAGDTICIRADTYYEQITIDKVLTLQGEDGPIIDSSGSGTVVRVRADNVTIKSLTIRNGEVGLDLSDAQNITLFDNHMTNSTYNFRVGFWSRHDRIEDFIHTIDDSNTVDGKPIYYWVNVRDARVPEDAGYVAVINSTGVIVENQNLSHNDYGMLFVSTTNSTVRNVTASNNRYGIKICNSTNCRILDNVARNNKYRGIEIDHSSNNVVNGNKVEYNPLYGFVLLNSGGNILRNNTMTGNKYNFGVALWTDELYLSDLINDIDTSNMVDGKRIYYLVNQHDLIMDPSSYPDLGYGALINSTNIVVEDFNLSHNRRGIRMGFSNSCVIRNITVSSCGWGITDGKGVNNTILENTISNCGTGIQIYGADDSNAISNTVLNCSTGIDVHSSRNCMIHENILKDLRLDGLSVIATVNITICRNTILNANWPHDGIFIRSCNNTQIYNNNLLNNSRGISMGSVSSFEISGNNFSKCDDRCFYLYWVCNQGLIYHNNFVNNTHHVIFSYGAFHSIFFDDGFEGNYWSDYTGVDLDPLDGIGDTSYVIDGNNRDNCPLMGKFSTFNTSVGCYVNVVSNSTIEDFDYFESNGTIKMYVFGEEGFGFCRVSIPHVLMNISSISVIIDDGLTPVLYHNYTLYDNGTHRWIYFAYPHSIHEIDIIPEFPSFLILPLFMIATTVYFAKRKPKTKQ